MRIANGLLLEPIPSAPSLLLEMIMVTRGAHLPEPYPCGPLRRDDADDVGQALPAGDAALLDEEQPACRIAFCTVVREQPAIAAIASICRTQTPAR